jgi:hypothetical protein
MNSQIIANGRIATLTKARKPHRCQECQGRIERGELYYAVIIAGSGVDGMKDADRVHVECLPEGIRDEGSHIHQG